VVIETSRGSRTKLAYDPELKTFIVVSEEVVAA